MSKKLKMKSGVTKKKEYKERRIVEEAMVNFGGNIDRLGFGAESRSSRRLSTEVYLTRI